MANTTLDGNVYVAGALSANSFSPPANSIGNAAIATGATGSYIAATKVQHQQSVNEELFGPAVAVTAVTKWVYIVRGATGTLVSVEAAIAVVASGADRTITVDVHKSTGAGAFATVLSGTIGFTNVTAVRTPVGGTISSTALVDGDILEVIVTVAGSAGNQATGLTCTLNIREDPQ